jgi:hypothetical protein
LPTRQKRALVAYNSNTFKYLFGMTKKISISVDDELLDYVDRESKNRSAFINQCIKEIRTSRQQEALRNAYLDQEQDPQFWSEFELWDNTIGDGISEEKA